MFKVGPLNKGFKGIKVVVEHIEDTDGILGLTVIQSAILQQLVSVWVIGRLSPLCGGWGGSRLSFAQHSDLSQDMPLSTDTCSQTLWKVHL